MEGGRGGYRGRSRNSEGLPRGDGKRVRKELVGCKWEKCSLEHRMGHVGEGIGRRTCIFIFYW